MRIAPEDALGEVLVVAGQSYAPQRNEGVVDLLAGQVTRNIKALDKIIGKDGFACSGRRLRRPSSRTASGGS